MLQSKKLLMNNMVTLTVSTSPVAATCTLTYNNVQYSTKTLSVPKGSTIAYSIYHSTYGTTSGSIIMDDDKTLTCTGTSGSSYTEVTWIRPNLTSNGTIGSSTFAVSTTRPYNSYPVYIAFDGIDNQNKSGCFSYSYSEGAQVTLYTSTPIKLKSFTWVVHKSGTQNQTANYIDVYGGNSQSSYTLLNSFTNDVVSPAGSTFTKNVNSTQYYRYHRLDVSKNYSQGYMYCRELYLNATYQSPTTTYYWNTSIT